ncbi:MAG: L-aspartate oxidase [Neomegalonema sp.]|nr:L-aspartate oxidase [Neomegalonema sp.]
MTSDTLFNTGGALIVGAGVAGLFAALKMAPRPVTLISPEPLGRGASSAWAQGGVAAAVGRDDRAELHAEDTIRAGAGSVDPDIATLVAESAPGIIEDLARLGAPFDRADDGGFALSREAAHRVARVVRVGGDGAGRAIMNALIAAAEATPSIRVVEGVIAVDLAVEDGRVRAVVCRRAGDRYSSPLIFRAEATLLAAGGLGGLYNVTTNPARVRGQAVGMAARAGAEIADAEFVQFHPTALNVGLDPSPLASEALRGEGALLIDGAGRRFMTEIHPDAELAPRDVVARAVFRQVSSGAGAFLDARTALGARFDAAFPTVAAACRAAGVDPTTQPIPVAPAAHYHMGGVAADRNARSSLAGLWVAGEAASTGLHGANRLASNGLLEALVFGARAAQDMDSRLSALALKPPGGEIELPEPRLRWGEEGKLLKLEAVAALRRTMSELCGVERDAPRLGRALAEIGRLEREAIGVSRSYLNMTVAATIVVASALRRKESRGGHYRVDFPTARPELATRSRISWAEAEALRAEHVG